MALYNRVFHEDVIVFPLRLPESLDDKVRDAAKQRGVSINTEINERLLKTP